MHLDHGGPLDFPCKHCLEFKVWGLGSLGFRVYLGDQGHEVSRLIMGMSGVAGSYMACKDSKYVTESP